MIAIAVTIVSSRDGELWPTLVRPWPSNLTEIGSRWISMPSGRLFPKFCPDTPTDTHSGTIALAGLLYKSLRCRWQTARRRGSGHAKYSVSHHVAIKPFLLLGLAAENWSRRWVWSTVVRRLSDTHRRTKLTALETISRSWDMVGAHQNLNGSRDLTTHLSATICHLWASACYLQPIANLKSLRKYERRYKMSKMGWFGVIRITQGNWKYHQSIEHMQISISVP